MINFLAWLKKYSLWIIGGIVTFLGLIFAIRQERDKIRQFKAYKEIEQSKIEAAKLRGIREQVLLHEGSLEKKDAALAIDIKALDKMIASLSEDRAKIAADMSGLKSSKDLVKKLNQKYR